MNLRKLGSFRNAEEQARQAITVELPGIAGITSYILPTWAAHDPKFLSTAFLKCAYTKGIEREDFFQSKSGYETILMLNRRAEFLEMTYEWKYDSVEHKVVLQRVNPQYRPMTDIAWENNFAGESMPLGAVTLYSLHEAQKETNRQAIVNYSVGLRIEDRQQRVLEQLGLKL